MSKAIEVAQEGVDHVIRQVLDENDISTVASSKQSPSESPRESPRESLREEEIRASFTSETRRKKAHAASRSDHSAPAETAFSYTIARGKRESSFTYTISDRPARSCSLEEG